MLTLDISKSKFIANYRYLKVNFLFPENLLWDTSSLRQQELKCKWKLENQCVQSMFFYVRGYPEKPVFDIPRDNYTFFF